VKAGRNVGVQMIRDLRGVIERIVTVEQAMALRDRAVRLPARRSDAFKRAAREEVPERQGRLDLGPR
jgi:hypothetical protein